MVHALAQWGERDRPRPTGRLEVGHDACGRVTESADTCSHCRVPIGPQDVSWRRPRDPDRLTPLVR